MKVILTTKEGSVNTYNVVDIKMSKEGISIKKKESEPWQMFLYSNLKMFDIHCQVTEEMSETSNKLRQAYSDSNVKTKTMNTSAYTNRLPI